MKETLVIPMRIQLGQFPHQSIVFAHPGRVHGRQTCRNISNHDVSSPLLVLAHMMNILLYRPTNENKTSAVNVMKTAQ